MKKQRKVFASILLAVLLLLGSGAQTVGAAGFKDHVKSYEWEQLYLTNRERLKQNLQPVSTFIKITQAARVRSKETVSNFSHIRPDGSSCFTALNQANVPYSWAGENIAAGCGTPMVATTAWMNSAGHRQNILTSQYTHLGVGYYNQPGSQYVHYWTQLFTGGCSVNSLSVYNMKTGKALGSTTLQVKKGTKLDDMELAGRVTCPTHGTSYFPLDAALCSGYSASKTSGTQTVTLSAYGLKATFKVFVLSALQSEKAPVLKRSLSGRNTVKLQWTAVNGAEKYQLYRKTKNGSYQRIATVTGTSYTDKKAVPGNLYYYRVRAIRGSETGKYSTNRSIQIQTAAPKILKATPGSGKIIVSWTPLKGADGYEVWCSVNGGSYRKARNILNGTTGQANHLNLSKGNYTYKVRAFWTENGKRVCGSFSGTCKATL